MSEPAHRKSALASTARHLLTRILMEVQCVALCAVLVFASLPAVSFAESPCAGIRVNVEDISNSTGTVACALFEAREGFPKEFLRYATRIMMMKVRNTQAHCNFLDIPPGEYALAVIHDENMNGELDTNALGVPTEGYGFSSHAKAFLSAPSFEDASFPYDGGGLDLTINLSYHAEPVGTPQYGPW